jgi:tripartite-type tricarboxylate transporter receptor subunit TctC
MRRRDVLTLASSAAASAAAAAAAMRPLHALAQDTAAGWPPGNVTLVSPFTPGGMSDVLGRALAEKLAPVFGRSFVVENRAGAGGALGATSVARAAPDGQTLLIAISASSLSIRASMPACNISR